MIRKRASTAPLAIHLLSETERECLRQVHGGFSSKDIAAGRGVRPDRIDKIINSARAKLGNLPRREAARRFVELEAADDGRSADPVPAPPAFTPTQSLGSQPLGVAARPSPTSDERVQPSPATGDATFAEPIGAGSPMMFPDIARSLRLAAAGRLRNDLTPFERSLAIATIAAAGACTAGAAMALLILLNRLTVGT